MAFTYTRVHRNYKSLAEEVKAIVKALESGEISDADVDEILAAWDDNCPNLLYEDDARTVVSSSLFRLIGKRRSTVLTVAFRRRRK